MPWVSYDIYSQRCLVICYDIKLEVDVAPSGEEIPHVSCNKWVQLLLSPAKQLCTLVWGARKAGIQIETEPGRLEKQPL